jgi:hypothetical protein
MHSFEIFRHYERAHWRLSDIDFSQIRTDLVKSEYVTLAKGAVMGESNVIAAVHGFLNEFIDDYDFSTFVTIWGYQEVQHHYAFKSWLVAQDLDVSRAAVDAMRAPYAPGTTPCATLATNIISELTVNHVYKALSNWTEEPVLKTILRKASLDEAAHAREFIYFAKKRLENRPEELPSVLETLYFYTSDDRLKHPVGVFKDGLEELLNHETIDTAFELFLDHVAQDGELHELHGKIRRTFGNMTGLDLSSNGRIRRALGGILV